MGKKTPANFPCGKNYIKNLWSYAPYKRIITSFHRKTGAHFFKKKKMQKRRPAGQWNPRLLERHLHVRFEFPPATWAPRARPSSRPPGPQGNPAYVWVSRRPTGRNAYKPQRQLHARLGFPPPKGPKGSTRTNKKPKPRRQSHVRLGPPPPKGRNARKQFPGPQWQYRARAGFPAARAQSPETERPPPKKKSCQAASRAFLCLPPPKGRNACKQKSRNPKGNPTRVWVSCRPKGGTRAKQSPGAPKAIPHTFGFPAAQS